METLKLEAKTRETTGKQNNQIREQGYAPAIIYGKSTNPINLMVLEKDFIKLYQQAGDNTIIDLNISDQNKVLKVLIQNIDFTPLKDRINNIEFLAISLTDTVTVDIPLKFINTEASEKLGGILIKTLHEIEVEALPTDIPHQIDIDCSNLTEFGSTIYVKDIISPKGVKILTPMDSPIISFDEPTKEEAPVETEAAKTTTTETTPDDNKNSDSEEVSKENN